MDEEHSARIFLAISISTDIAEAVGETQRALGRGSPAGFFRFASPEQAHVTLKFFGRRSRDEQTRIARCAELVAARASPFVLAFGGVGVFPDERRPHTLWMGLSQGRSDVARLASQLEAELALAGFAPEARAYVPHLTLARIRQRPAPAMMTKLLGSSIDDTRPERVASFALMESRATRAGVRYVPLRIFRLETACLPSK
jgi:RNA 2',3'-cyclic 3'-phosphodiesterase